MAVNITEYNRDIVQPLISQTSYANTLARAGVGMGDWNSDERNIDFRKIRIYMEVNVVFAIK